MTAGWNRISEWAGGLVAILVAIVIAICLWSIIFPARWGARRRRWGLHYRGVAQRSDRRVHVPEDAGSTPAPAPIFCGDLSYDRRHTCLLSPGHLGLHHHGDHAWEPRRDDIYGDDLHRPGGKPVTFKDIPWAGAAPPGTWVDEFGAPEPHRIVLSTVAERSRRP